MLSENERRLESLNKEHKIELDTERKRTEEAFNQVQAQEVRLRDTIMALEAASRLSEIVDKKEAIIVKLKCECKNRMRKSVIQMAIKKTTDECLSIIYRY